MVKIKYVLRNIAGCDDFISKPFDKNEVLSRVKALLKISYYRSLLDEKEKFEYLIEHMEDCRQSAPWHGRFFF